MSFNKNLFSEHLNNKDYNFCISLLRNEITDILTKRIQEKDCSFVYSTVSSLRKAVFTYLSDDEKEIIVEFQQLHFEESPSYYELSRMMELYKNLLEV